MPDLDSCARGAESSTWATGLDGRRTTPCSTPVNLRYVGAPAVYARLRPAERAGVVVGDTDLGAPGVIVGPT